MTITAQQNLRGTQPSSGHLPRVAIIGAGLAGLVLASRLQHIAEVTVFEKSRGVGGRMATRRVDDFQFDHGARFFTARSRAFKTFLQPWLDSGLVQEWTPRITTLSPIDKPYKRDWFEPHYVAVPGMTALAKAMAASLTVVNGYEVNGLTKTGQGWQLEFTDAPCAGPFDWVLAATPAPQILRWFPDSFTGYADLAEVRYLPCFSLMLGYGEELPMRWDTARIKDSALDWVVKTNSLPGRPSLPGLVIGSTGVWAQQYLEETSGTISVLMSMALKALPELALPVPINKTVHRWRYAEVTESAAEPCYLDSGLQLGACGDWGIGGRVEAAFESATTLLQQLEPQLKRA